MGLFGVDIDFDPFKLVNDSINGIYGLVDGVKAAVMENVNSVYDYLKTIYQEAVTRFDAVMKTVDELGGSLRATITGVIDDAVSSIRALYESLSSGIVNLKEAVRALPDSVRGIVSGLIHDARKALESALSAMQAVIMGGIEPIGKDVKMLVDALTNPDKLGDLLLRALVAVW